MSTSLRRQRRYSITIRIKTTNKHIPKRSIAGQRRYSITIRIKTGKGCPFGMIFSVSEKIFHNNKD